MAHQEAKLTKLEDLSLDSNRGALKSGLARIVDELVGIFRQSAANEGFTFGPITLRNTDLDRIHRIITEIDSRRAFYEAFNDELPEEVIDSVHALRGEVRSQLKGIWADATAERIAQQLMRALNDFVTASRALVPMPQWHRDERWPEFVKLTADLRLRVWSLVAFLKLKLGNVIRPSNLPVEILQTVKESDLASV